VVGKGIVSKNSLAVYMDWGWAVLGGLQIHAAWLEEIGFPRVEGLAVLLFVAQREEQRDSGIHCLV
jgi:hypothetical protein